MFQLAAPVESDLEIKKSRFIGQLYPVTTRAEAKAILAALRVRHPHAVHVCWVLICEGDSGLDDDGEPGGTAARPMYNVLVHKDLTNVLAVVVRYWGGIKLGAGALVRAYSQAISDACKLAQLVAVEKLCQRRITMQFADESALRRVCQQFDAQILDASYGVGVTLEVQLKQQLASEFDERVNHVLRGVPG